MMEGDPSGALESVNEALKYAPHEPRALALRGQIHLAGKRFEAATADFQKAVELNSDDALFLNNFAWNRIISPNRQSWDPALSVQCAQMAIALAPEERPYWNTLGAAQYRAGQWTSAIDSLQKSMELGAGGDAYDWFLLAMSHWQLNDKGEARQWHSRAIEWLRSQTEISQDLDGLRAEAEELMGIAESDKPLPVDSPPPVDTVERVPDKPTQIGTDDTGKTESTENGQ
jgi:Flp pilus assembly protein TadD